MATFRAEKQVDMLALPEFFMIQRGNFGFPSPFTDTHLTIPGFNADAHVKLDMIGEGFGLSSEPGALFRGTIHTLSALTHDTLAYEFTTPGYLLEDLWDYARAGDLNGALTQFFPGNDTIDGSAFGDRLFGFARNDLIRGGNGDDKLDGDGGNDTIVGGKGADTIDGDTGVDAASYADSKLGVTVSLAVVGKQKGGDAGGDKLAGIENLIGTAKVDKLSGNGARNTLDGGNGSDVLAGGSGDDTLIGGRGSDTLTGGPGRDTFVFAAGFGRDTITDFVEGAGLIDRISIAKSLLANFNAVKSHASVNSDGDVVIKINSANTITLTTVDKVSDLHANDFLFTT